MAKKFVFNLQTVLEQREREEESAKRALSAVERERLALEAHLGKLHTRIGESRRELREELAPAAGGGVRVVSVRLQASASLHMTAQAQRGAIELAGVYKRMDAARGVLLRAKAARRAVELLKEKRLAQWKLENRRAEEREADEMNVMRHAHRETLA